MSDNIIDNRKKRFFNANRLTAYAFLLPNLIGFLVFTLIPMAAVFLLCFVKFDFANPMEFIGLKNFTKLFTDSGFQISMFNTFYYMITTVPLTIVISLFLAILLHQKLKGRTVFRTIFFFPYIASMVAVAVIWNMLYHPTLGPINAFLRMLGISNPPEWTSSVVWAMPAIIFMSVWKQVGYYLIIYLAGMNNIPEQLYEVATIDGATFWQKFKYITFPMLTPATFFITVLLVINSFKVFDQIVIMTDGGPGRATYVLVYYIYYQAFQFFKFGFASAVSVVLFLFVLILTIIQFKVENKWVNYQST